MNSILSTPPPALIFIHNIVKTGSPREECVFSITLLANLPLGIAGGWWPGGSSPTWPTWNPNCANELARKCQLQTPRLRTFFTPFTSRTERWKMWQELAQVSFTLFPHFSENKINQFSVWQVASGKWHWKLARQQSKCCCDTEIYFPEATLEIKF